MIRKSGPNLLKTNIMFGILYLSFATPYVFFVGGIPAVMQLEGFDTSLIGLFQLIGLPVVIKFLLSPVVDRIRFQKHHYKKWIGLCGIAYAATLYSLSSLSLSRDFYTVFIVIFFATLLYIFIDIPLNALAIKVFSSEDRIAASGCKTSAYFLSGMAGSGMLLVVYNHLGWHCTFTLVSGWVLISLSFLFFIEEADEPMDEPVEDTPASLHTILTFFRRPGMGIWLFILTFYFTFILSVWMFIKPYLIVKGLSTDEVAFYVGIYGSGVGFCAGILASHFGKSLSKRDSLLFFGFLMMISILILILMEAWAFNILGVLAAVTFISVSIAFSTTMVFSLIMEYSRQNTRGVDYAVQSSLTSIVRILTTIGAGFLISNFGYEALFYTGFLGTGAVVYVVYKRYGA
nr:MFS transporter [uncultured Desulfobacter sp.]